MEMRRFFNENIIRHTLEISSELPKNTLDRFEDAIKVFDKA